MKLSPCLKVTNLLFAMSSSVLLMTIAAVPLFHYHEPTRTTVAGQVVTTPLGASNYKIWIGLYDSTIYHRTLGRSETETNDYWKDQFRTCADSEMVSTTKAMQAFWIASVISSVLLVGLFSTQWCCNPIKQIYVFAMQLVTIICVVVASACAGYLYSHNFCPSAAGNVLRDLDGLGFDLSTGAFFLFTAEVLLFFTTILTCCLTFCISKEEPKDTEPEDREMDGAVYPQSNSYPQQQYSGSQQQYSGSQQQYSGSPPQYSQQYSNQDERY